MYRARNPNSISEKGEDFRIGTSEEGSLLTARVYGRLLIFRFSLKFFTAFAASAWLEMPQAVGFGLIYWFGAFSLWEGMTAARPSGR